jgi:hypothetical protein
MLLEKLITAINNQSLNDRPAKPFKKMDNKDSFVGHLSVHLQKFYRLLLKAECDIDDLLDGLTDRIMLFDMIDEKQKNEKASFEFHETIKCILENEYAKVRQYRLVKTAFEAELGAFLNLSPSKFTGIRDGSIVVTRSDNSRGDRSQAEEFFLAGCSVQKQVEIHIGIIADTINDLSLSEAQVN